MRMNEMMKILTDCNLYILTFIWVTANFLPIFIPILVLLKKLFLKNSKPVAKRLLIVTLILFLVDGIVFKITTEMVSAIEQIR